MKAGTEALIIDSEFRSLIPPLTPDEFRQLEENIKRDGCRDPLAVWNGVLLDGHNRHEICSRFSLPYKTADIQLKSRDEAKAWIIKHQFGRRNLQPFQRAELVFQLEPLIAAKAKDNQRLSEGPGRKGLQNSADLKPVDTRAELARISGLSHDTIHRARAISRMAPPEVQEKLRTGETSINAEYQKLKRGTDQLQRIEERRKSPPLPAGTFNLIYADPPWRYEYTESENRAIENQYPTMSIDEICNLPIAQIAAADCVLFLWATSPKLEDSLRVLNLWGFSYRTCAVWDKEKIGMGYYFRQQHELLLVATRGEPGTPLPPDRPPSVLRVPRLGHSVKPDEAYGLLERMYPHATKCELFQRRPREGWTGWGNEPE